MEKIININNETTLECKCCGKVWTEKMYVETSGLCDRCYIHFVKALWDKENDGLTVNEFRNKMEKELK